MSLFHCVEISREAISIHSQRIWNYFFLHYRKKWCLYKMSNHALHILLKTWQRIFKWYAEIREVYHCKELIFHVSICSITEMRWRDHERYWANHFDRRVDPCVRRGRLLLAGKTVRSCPSYGPEGNYREPRGNRLYICGLNKSPHAFPEIFTPGRNLH